jgi:hypothetical protein
MFPHVTLKKYVRTDTDSKQNWILASLKLIKTEVQVAGGNPTFLKDNSSDGLPTSEIWMGYDADWQMCRIEGREIREEIL